VVALAVLACETGPTSPGASCLTTIEVLVAPSWWASAVAPTPCVRYAVGGGVAGGLGGSVGEVAGGVGGCVGGGVGGGGVGVGGSAGGVGGVGGVGRESVVSPTSVETPFPFPPARVGAVVGVVVVVELPFPEAGFGASAEGDGTSVALAADGVDVPADASEGVAKMPRTTMAAHAAVAACRPLVATLASRPPLSVRGRTPTACRALISRVLPG
jgi:hypothetical protein